MSSNRHSAAPAAAAGGLSWAWGPWTLSSSSRRDVAFWPHHLLPVNPAPPERYGRCYSESGGTHPRDGGPAVERRGQVRVGTSGWIYKHWKGAVYPAGLPVARWL